MAVKIDVVQTLNSAMSQSSIAAVFSLEELLKPNASSRCLSEIIIMSLGLKSIHSCICSNAKLLQVVSFDWETMK
jgi:hypothetical protein